MKLHNYIQRLTFLLTLAVSGGWLMSCNEEVDMSDRYTFTDETVLSFLQKDLERDDNKRPAIAYENRFTEYVQILNQVPISDYSSATVAQLLSARGNYTVFAPNNKAIANYLQELKDKQVITEASWNGFNNIPNGAAVLDSIRKVIVYNSIIDCNDQEAYNLGTFPTGPTEPFDRSNLNDRKLFWTYEPGSSTPDTRYLYINGKALIDLSQRDLEAINGRIHAIHAVISPSNETMRDIFDKWVTEQSGQFTVFARLLRDCGLFDTLSKTRDEAWETVFKTSQVTDLEKHPSYGQYGHVPEHRKYGFTIFAEPDDLWETELASVGITKTAAEITTEDVKNYLMQKGVYADATTGSDYTNENNIINQFVTYHVLPEALSSGNLVIHYNEKGHKYTDRGKKSIPVYDYYTTMGKRRLLKIFESAESNGIFLNRFPVLRNWRGRFSYENENINDYHESGDFKDIQGTAMYNGVGEDGENRGVQIIIDTESSSDDDPLNGYIYALDRMLVYTDNIKQQLHGERIRMDCATMFPEMINNDWRRPMGDYQLPRRCTHGNCTRTVGFPSSPEYPYFKDMWIEKGTKFYYLSGYAQGWSNYQMDEFNVVGNYEFTMKLPPVPVEDIYELRFGVSAGSNNRSMCQVYWGEDRSYLPAAGIPMDLRVGFVTTRFYGSASQISPFGYTSQSDYAADAKLSQEEQDEIDKLLRSRGYMKGPEYFYYGTESNDANVGRNWDHVTRRVMVRARMKPDKTYYIRFKNVLQNEKLEFYMDYLEFVSKDVYDNPNEPEDIW